MLPFEKWFYWCYSQTYQANQIHTHTHKNHSNTFILAELCVSVFVAISALKFFNYCPKLIIQQCYKRIKSESQRGKKKREKKLAEHFFEPWCRSTDTVVFLNALWPDQRRNRINGCQNSFFCWFIWLLVCRFWSFLIIFCWICILSLFCVCDLLWWINGPKNSERMCTFYSAWNGNTQQQRKNCTQHKNEMHSLFERTTETISFARVGL